MKKLHTSAFLIDNKATLQNIIHELEKDFPYVSILGTDVSTMRYQVSTSGTTLAPTMDEQRGFVVRVYQDCGYTEYSFNVLDKDRVCQKVRSLAKEDRAAFARNKTLVQYNRLPNDERAEHFYVAELARLPEEEQPQEIIEKLQRIHDSAKAKYPEIVQVAVIYSYAQVNKLFLSKNRDLYQSYAYSIGTAFAVSSNESNTQQDYLTCSGLCGAELTDELEILANEACKRAVELLHAEKVIPGDYDIICDPDFTGLIAHEAFGHGAEMDMFVKNRAKGMEFVGKRVASDKVEMHDGATSAPEVSSYLFDDEGNLGKDTVIIDRGILKTGICDELSAILLGTESTGNGKRESYKRKAYTRMTNTFFSAGNDSLEDMIASIEKGYLLEGFSSGMEDPKNWGIQCVASKGREIIDGKLSGKIVTPVYLTGYVPDLLNSISMVSDGLKLSGSGYCGKGWKEWVKTSTGGSYIKARGRLS